MTRPGTTITLRDTPLPASAPTDTTVQFATGLADKGPLEARLITSMADFERIFGLRQSYSILYDALEDSFREGVGSIYVSRVVGPASTIGSKNLNDNVAAISLVVKAIGPGAYSTGIKVGVVAGVGGGTYQIKVTDAADVLLEQSPDLIDQQAAVNWAQQSQYIRITVGASALNPVVVATGALSAGTDDRANITEADWTTALGRFSADLGPGQVTAPGRSTDAAHTNLLAHAIANGRVAILDPPNSNDTAVLKTSVVSARVGNQRFGGTWGPWQVVPGIVPGTFRTVPPSSLICGLISRNEAQFGPNSPSAGDAGISRFAIDLSQPAWTDPQREDLSNNGFNVILRRRGAIVVYGWRSLVDPVADPYWVDFGNARLYTAIAAEANLIAEQFLFDQIDGQGHTISAFGGALAGMLLGFYALGALYGATPADAFAVDVGPQVNTPLRLQNNELHAVLNVRMSPMAELVAIEIVKTPVAQAVS